MSYLDLGDGTLHYSINGIGQAVVLIPGFASGRWSWLYQTDELAKSLRVSTFDPRGVANSTSTNSEVTIDKIADDVVGLLDHLQISRAHILGISFGGFVAQDLAVRYPERVNKLVLACTSAGGAGHIAPSPEVLAAFSSVQGLNTADRIRHYLTLAFTSDFTVRSPSVVDEFCRLREVNHVPEKVYLEQMSSAMRFDYSSRAAEITAPTLVITGDEDRIVPMENSVNLAEAIPNSRLEIIPGEGHMFFVESPALFNGAVIKFLLNR